LRRIQMSQFVTYFPVKIVFGEGQLANIGDHAAPLGRRALLVADAYWVAAGLAAEVAGLLKSAGVETTISSAFSPNPLCSEIDELGRLARDGRCDTVVGLGGGSAIDAAKAVAVIATHEGSIDSFVRWHRTPKLVTAATLPIVAIPTTSGTGAEATIAAVMSDPVTHRKTALVSPHIYPRVALVDPELSASMPPSLTAATGLDAMSHAIEAILCPPLRNYFSDMVAFEAVAAAARYLPRAYQNGSDMEARAKMAWASTLGGMSIATSGTTTPHALAQPLGVHKNWHHGLTIAIFLPAILEKSWEADLPTFDRLATALGVPQEGLSLGARARSVSAKVRDLMEVTGLNAEIAGLSIDRATADAILDDANAYLRGLVDRHVKAFSREELAEIIEKSITIVNC
jgi:alcohol dehydrogenase class IV